MSRKKEQPRPRDEWAYFKFSEKIQKIDCRIVDDEVEIIGSDPQFTKTDRSYERMSGKDKVELSIPSCDGKASFSPERQLLRQYKWLLAVDTNYITLKDVVYACTVVYATTEELYPGIKEVPYAPLVTYLFKNPRSNTNPELIGWHLALKHLYQPRDRSQIGMVVDSEAGNLSAFNSRVKPYLDEYVLPSYVDLIYASADQGSKLPNQMIKLCDKVGAQVLNYFRAHGGLSIVHQEANVIFTKI
ncbi:hypothetical protein [Halomonas sp. KO116]|uniref:hypothetical protein n=1 Tax=Halomonas sp. KO116 TaxID=1504981 RepID=UPI0004E46A2D|nr:hypothetical protein [Halomonas sp. KO116]AJY51505.1 hypothetical protein KO116_03032 [Halomonas sp. KO116]